MNRRTRAARDLERNPAVQNLDAALEITNDANNVRFPLEVFRVPGTPTK